MDQEHDVLRRSKQCVRDSGEFGGPTGTLDLAWKRGSLGRWSSLLAIIALTAACSNSGTLSAPATSLVGAEVTEGAAEPVETSPGPSMDPQDEASAAEEPSTEVAAPDSESDALSPVRSWVPPDDPHAAGPTEAPVLPVESGDLDEALELSTDMTVSVESVIATTVTAETPGEVSGPALIVTVTLTNTGSEPQRIDSAVVAVVADNGDLAIPTTAGPNNPFGGEVLPGQSATGQYVYMLDPAKGRSITVSVNYSAGAPVAEFSGEVL